MGIVRGEVSFGVILEYVPCGDLERLLMLERDIPIPWKLRARFFLELANALDYLHSSNPKKIYIHGDLKPQNILLSETLEIKLADFGAATIAKLTGASSVTVCNIGNTQHTPYYTAPEFLNNPNQPRRSSMDVYSYGMICYEIITRQTIYSGSHVPHNTLLYLIERKGQKPDESCIQEVENSLIEGSVDACIFNKLKETMIQCWQAEPEQRSTMSSMKNNLNALAQSENIYDNQITKDAKSIVVHRKLITYESRKTQSHQFSVKRLLLSIFQWFVYIFSFIIASKIIFWILSLTLQMWFTSFVKIPTKSEEPVIFFLIDGVKLQKPSIIGRTSYPPTFFPRAFMTTNPADMQSIVKINDLVYLISSLTNQNAYRTNVSVSDPYTSWEKVKWPDRYKNRRYIAYKDSIFAVGAYNNNITSRRKLTVEHGQSADLYIPAINGWVALPNTNQWHYGHALVIFNELICSTGGLYARNPECFNESTYTWTTLPPMLLPHRYQPAAVALNGELYVIGGAWPENIKHPTKEHTVPLDSVERFNPQTNSWIEVAKLQDARFNHCAGVFNGEIYVVGETSSMIEKYDPVKNIWYNMGALPNAKPFRKFIPA